VRRLVQKSTSKVLLLITAQAFTYKTLSPTVLFLRFPMLTWLDYL